MSTQLSTVITLPILATSAFAECPTFVRVTLSQDDIEALYERYTYACMAYTTVSYDVTDLTMFQWTDVTKHEDFYDAVHIYPDTVKAVITHKGLKFECAYLGDENQPIDTFETLPIDLEEVILLPTELNLID